MFRYACAISIFTNLVPGPMSVIVLTLLSFHNPSKGVAYFTGTTMRTIIDGVYPYTDDLLTLSNISMRVASSFATPSFMLYPGGYERSRIKRHFPCWCHFGISPNLLTWTPFASDSVSGPATRYSLNSLCKYSMTGFGFTSADCMFLAANCCG